MASVVRQMHALDFLHRSRIAPFSTTRSQDGDEPGVARLARHIRHLRRLDNVIQRTDARIVHIHTCSGFSLFRSVADMFVAKRSGCRTILHIHGASFDEFHERAGIVTNNGVAWALGHCACGVALAAMAAAAGWPMPGTVREESGLEPALSDLRGGAGPVFYAFKVRAEDLPLVLPPRDGEHLKDRFRAALLGGGPAAIDGGGWR